MRGKLDIVTDVVETHTYDYHLYVDACQYDDWSMELLTLCPSFLDCGYKGGGHWFGCDITCFDCEDRIAIHAFIDDHGLDYHLERILRAMND